MKEVMKRLKQWRNERIEWKVNATICCMKDEIRNQTRGLTRTFHVRVQTRPANPLILQMTNPWARNPSEVQPDPQPAGWVTGWPGRVETSQPVNISGPDNQTLLGCLITHRGLSFEPIADSKAIWQLNMFPR